MSPRLRDLPERFRTDPGLLARVDELQRRIRAIGGTEDRDAVRGELLALTHPTTAARALPELHDAYRNPETVGGRSAPGSHSRPMPKGDGARRMAEAILEGLSRSSSCQICGRALTDPSSVELGIGPDCLAKHGGAISWAKDFLDGEARRLMAPEEDEVVEEITAGVRAGLDALHAGMASAGVEIDHAGNLRPSAQVAIDTTYETLDAYYSDPVLGETRRLSPEADYGVHWPIESGARWPAARVTHVYATGEIIAVIGHVDGRDHAGYGTRVIGRTEPVAENNPRRYLALEDLGLTDWPDLMRHGLPRLEARLAALGVRP